jgi:hypothetical protein
MEVVNGLEYVASLRNCSSVVRKVGVPVSFFLHIESLDWYFFARGVALGAGRKHTKELCWRKGRA